MAGGAYLDLRDYDKRSALFLNAKGQPISRFGIGYIVKGYHHLAQEKCPSLREIKVTPHTFRHTVAFLAVAAGAAMPCVQDLLGHASVETTRRYFKTSLEMKQKAHEAIESPGKEIASGPETRNWLKPDLLQYLDNLSRVPGGRATRLNRSS